MALTEEQMNALTGAVTTGVSLVSGLNANKDLYPQCGKRPFFTGKRRDAYDACVATQPLPPIKSETGGTDNFFNTPSENGEETFFQKYKTPMLIGGGLILAFTLYKFSKRK
jgi:hypothetical protein